MWEVYIVEGVLLIATIGITVTIAGLLIIDALRHWKG